MLNLMTLILQVILFSVVVYLVSAFFGNGSFQVQDFLIRCLPVNWFVILYSALYVLIPFINRMRDALTQSARNVLMIVVVCLCFIWPTVVDLLQALSGKELHGLSTISYEGSLEGYSIVQFVAMFLMGRFLRDKTWVCKASMKKLATALGIVWLSLALWMWFGRNAAIGSVSGSYSNPLVVALAVLVFLLFLNMKKSPPTWVNHIAKASFTVFIFHPVLLPYLQQEYVLTRPWYVMIPLIVLTLALVYGAGWIVYHVYSFLVKPVDSLIDKKWKRGRIICVSAEEE